MTTNIEWCDETWNPITGCTPVSRGCDNCYAARMAARLRGRFGYPQDWPFRPGVLHEDKLEDPLHWKKPRRIFVCSMGDIFHEYVHPEHIDRVLEVIEACPQHTFIVLTKRPENIMDKLYGFCHNNVVRCLGGGDYIRNLWIGVTCEDQATADKRIPSLLEIPAAVRFVSIEPMLGPVFPQVFLNAPDPYCDMCKGIGYYGDNGPGIEGNSEYTRCECSAEPSADMIDWVICGAETGTIFSTS